MREIPQKFSSVLLRTGFLIIFLLPVDLYGTDDKSVSSPVASLMYESYSFILCLLAALLVICLVVIFFSVKMRKMNSELQKKNKQILEINEDLKTTNKELAAQKEIIRK